MKKITIMQPAYLPWLGFFDRVDASDLFIVLDNVQLDTNSKTRFTNRNKIRTKEGWIWLSLPMKTKGFHGQSLIKDIELVEDNWNVKHLKSIENNYCKTPYFHRYYPSLKEIYKQKWGKMQDLIDVMTQFFMESLHIKTPIIKSSEIPVSSKKSQLILDLCKYADATTYYSGVFGKEYLAVNDFTSEGIEIFFHDYKHPVYQQYFPGFEPYMSVIDLLFNYGDESIHIIRQGRNFTKAQ